MPGGPRSVFHESRDIPSAFSVDDCEDRVDATEFPKSLQSELHHVWNRELVLMEAGSREYQEEINWKEVEDPFFSRQSTNKANASRGSFFFAPQGVYPHPATGLDFSISVGERGWGRVNPHMVPCVQGDFMNVSRRCH